jgi:hypothetical protein
MMIWTRRQRCLALSVARLDPLHGLLACLRGEMPAVADWPAIIALANKTLCSPTVATRLRDAGRLADVPPDVHLFLGEMESRNAERNDRLLAQLDEAAAVMNAHGVRPILLKGTAWLAHSPPQQRSGRMLADIDLMVAADRFSAMIEQLCSIGYQPESLDLPPGVPAVLSRPQDAATIDLHSEYGSPSTLFYRYDDLASAASEVDLPGSMVLLPSPVACTAILLLHDQLKGRDYLRGRIDLRHLLDMQSYTAHFEEADWTELNRLFGSAYARNAMRTQLLTARKLLGLKVPRSLTRGVRARLQYGRRLIQLRWPGTAPLLTLLSLLDPCYLAARRASRRKGGDGTSLEGAGLPRRDSLERLFIRNELGKI